MKNEGQWKANLLASHHAVIKCRKKDIKIVLQESRDEPKLTLIELFISQQISTNILRKDELET
jgi:hypothetical protein